MTESNATGPATSMVAEDVVIDGLQICNWSRDVLLENREGGVHAMNATCAVWEGPVETMQNIGDLYQLFSANADAIRQVFTAEDIVTAKRDGVVGVLLGFQNASPFADDYTLVEVFHRLGVRVGQLTYNVQNHVGGACYDPHDSGLTRFGERIVAEMNRVGMIVDLSHVGNRTSRDAVEASADPVAITHANPLWFCDTPRNKPDDVINAVAERGGIVGCCLYPNVTGGSETTHEAFSQMVADLVEQIGIDHVALASDSVRGWPDSYVSYLRNGRWQPPADGVPAPVWPEWPDWFSGPKQFGNLAKGLEAVGLEPDDVAKIMGGNWLRYFKQIFGR